MKVSFLRKENDPNVVRGMKVPYAPAKRYTAQMRWYIILLLVTSPLLYFLFKLSMAWLIVSAPGFISLDQIEVNSKATGIVTGIDVQVGQPLAEGQTIARLYDPDLSSQITLQRAELNALQPGLPPVGATQAAYLKKRIALAEENLMVATDYLKNIKFLFSQGAATMAELDLARERSNRAKIEYDQALYDYGRLGPGMVKPAMLTDTAAEAQRLKIEAQIMALSDQQARLIQTAPFAGRVLDIFAKEGESIANGAPILLLGRAQNPYVEAYLPPKYAGYARKGHAAVVRLSDGTKLPAVVREDATLTKRLPADLSSPIGSRDIMLLVRLDLVAPLPAIEWVHGMPVSVRFKFF
ncbi:MAG: HlyD family efflux transporter periplasmic adaptor subunit [Desulfobacteraceae bacterium]|nr:HlyD family efflux transporter periplasmic adaptor subunit [Desulfobacteraceae bacterium]